MFYAQSNSTVTSGRRKWSTGNVSLQSLISMKSPAVGVGKSVGGRGDGGGGGVDGWKGAKWKGAST